MNPKLLEHYKKHETDLRTALLERARLAAQLAEVDKRINLALAGIDAAIAIAKASE